MPTYLIRGIDPDLWRLVKTKAASESLSVKAVIEQLLRTWVKS